MIIHRAAARRRWRFPGLALCAFALATGLAAAPPPGKLSIYDFNLPDIDGKMLSFQQFKGKAVLIVNVASDSICTPQYAGLESLYEKYKSAGLVILGIPSDDFGGQEPAPEAKIKTFVTSNYHVTFPMLSKVEVRGDTVTPLFHYLTSEANPKLKGDVHWNFTKFLVDRKGALAARFESDALPDDPDIAVAIEKALAGKASDVSPQTPPVPPPDDRPGPPTRSRE